jgi:protein involved in polysaccharide export with SLBB domain
MIKETLIAEAEERYMYLQAEKKLFYVCFVAILVMLGIFGSGHSSAQSRALAPNSEKNQTSAGKSLATENTNPKNLESQRPTTVPNRKNDSVKYQADLADDELPDLSKAGVATPSVPEDVPTEFQRLIQSSSGKLLPIFGRELFSAAPSTFAPIDRIPVTADYQIGPGDEIIIRAWGQIDIDYRATVDRNGEIFVPKVGNINLSGLKYHQLNGYLKTFIGRIFKNFDLTTSLGQLRSIQIYLVGHANRPGTYTVSSMSTVISALFAAGGPSLVGSMRSIQLKRAGAVVADIDLYNLISKGDITADMRLLPGDVIFIPPVGPQAAVSGSVNKPAIFELKGSTSLRQILELAGGVSSVGSADKVTVERIANRKNRTVEEFDWNRTDPTMSVANGDLVHVWPISPMFERTVTLRGNVHKTSRRPWREGMRLSDLIPSKEVLISPEYWVRQNSQTIPSELESENVGLNREKNDSKVIQENDQKIKGLEKADIKRMLEEVNWEYAVIERLDANTLQQTLIPFNLGQLLLEKNDESNLSLMPGDTVVIFSKNDLPVPVSQQTKFVTLAGEFKSAGIYKALPGETLQQLVKRVGGITGDAYLYAAEFTRESNRVTQTKQLQSLLDRMERDLEGGAASRLQSATDAALVAAEKANIEARRVAIQRMRALKPTGRIPLELSTDADIENFPDIALEDGDKLTIRPKPSVVYVMGSVFNENSFIYRPNKTYEEYLALAGGVTRDADDSRTYVLRADGTVVPEKNSWFKLGSNKKLMPGDAIVVPEKQDKSTLTKQFRDWTQILYQFGIGVAALKVLRN